MACATDKDVRCNLPAAHVPRNRRYRRYREADAPGELEVPLGASVLHGILVRRRLGVDQWNKLRVVRRRHRPLKRGGCADVRALTRGLKVQRGSTFFFLPSSGSRQINKGGKPTHTYTHVTQWLARADVRRLWLARVDVSNRHGGDSRPRLFRSVRRERV